jgi:hypothetical protein
MESDPVTFAGYGDPLLRLSAVEAAAKAIKHRRHGAQLRVMTNGEQREREREFSRASLPIQAQLHCSSHVHGYETCRDNDHHTLWCVRCNQAWLVRAKRLRWWRG